MVSTINKLYRCILMMIGIGHVTKVNDAGAVQEIQIKLGSDEIRDNTPYVQHFGFASCPPRGTDCVTLSAKGDRSTTVAIGTNHKESRPRNKADGETQIYDLWGKKVYLTKDGIVIEAQNTPVIVKNATTVTIIAATEIIMDTPLLKVKGDIIDRYESNQHTMNGFREIYNDHHHDGVQTGGGSTSIPDAQL